MDDSTAIDATTNTMRFDKKSEELLSLSPESRDALTAIGVENIDDLILLPQELINNALCNVNEMCARRIILYIDFCKNGRDLKKATTMAKMTAHVKNTTRWRPMRQDQTLWDLFPRVGKRQSTLQQRSSRQQE